MLRLMTYFRKSLPSPKHPGLQPKDLNGSIKLLEFTSELVDIFDNTNQPIFSVQDPRLLKVIKAKKFFIEWEKDKCHNAKHLLSQQTREDVYASLEGFNQLCCISIPKGIHINPGYINSDTVENFFCQQRGLKNGMNTNPTVGQYGPGVNSIILGQVSVSRKANTGTKALPFSANKHCVLNPRGKKKKSSAPKPVVSLRL